MAVGQLRTQPDLLTLLAETNFCANIQERLKTALFSLADKARAGAIAIQGKRVEEAAGDGVGVLTQTIPSVAFADFCAFDITTDGLRYGKGLLWLPNSANSCVPVSRIAQETHFIEVCVSYSQLKRELNPGKPSLPPLANELLQNWWDGLSDEEKHLGEAHHSRMLKEAFPSNHVSRTRIRVVRGGLPRSRGRPQKIATK